MPIAAYRITGKVQSVGYRAFVARLAESYGLAGYAHNVPDGSVEVCLYGEQQALTTIAKDLQRGPPKSNVTAVTPMTPRVLIA